MEEKSIKLWLLMFISLRNKTCQSWYNLCHLLVNSKIEQMRVIVFLYITFSELNIIEHTQMGANNLHNIFINYVLYLFSLGNCLSLLCKYIVVMYLSFTSWSSTFTSREGNTRSPQAFLPAALFCTVITHPGPHRQLANQKALPVSLSKCCRTSLLSGYWN